MKLYLDDVREVKEASYYTGNQIYQEAGWVIVRNYDDFVECVKSLSDLPEVISFDHDLGAEHYPTSRDEEEIDYSKYKEKTGYDCAKWLIEYCKYLHMKLPQCLCHSMNPVGKKNIETLIANAQ